jgi:predicted SPOUT superfamily RNA methylase MTH1
MSAARVTSRISTIQRHLNAVAVVPLQYWGYTMQMNVSHDDKVIDFVTESMTVNDKMEVFHRQRRMMRELYPEYIITETHQ